MNVDPESQTEAVVNNVFDLLELEPPVLPGDITVLVEDHNLGFECSKSLQIIAPQSRMPNRS